MLSTANCQARIISNRTLRSGASGPLVLGVFSVVALIAIGASVWYLTSRDDTALSKEFSHTVERSEFLLEVSEKGEIESAENVNIRCEVAQRSGRGVKILEIVPEGTVVKEGDFLVRLDSAELEQEQIKQKIEVSTKEAALEESKNKLDAAQIALEEYDKGTYLQEMQQIEGEEFKALEKRKRAEEYLEHSKRLAAKGYIPQQQLEADAFALESADNELEMVRTKKRVLKDYTYQKKMKDLESAIKTSEAKKEAADEALALEEDKLEELDDQITKCLITAPAKGVVKYAQEDKWGNDDRNVIEEGREVYQRQVLIQLPNPENMQVRMKVNESIVNRIKKDMPATISIIGFRDATLPGKVSKVFQYSEPTSWRRGGVKEFAIEVQIDGADPRLRTGMTAQVAVECLRKQDAMQVPVQAVYAKGKDHFCVLEDNGKQKVKKVQLGVTNDKFVVIEKGLEIGDVVTLSPNRFFDREAPLLEGAAETKEIKQASRKRQAKDQPKIQQTKHTPSDKGPVGKAPKGKPSHSSKLVGSKP